MSVASWTLEFDWGSLWTPTTDVLSLSINVGRQNALDTYGASTGEVVIRRTSSNSTYLDSIVPDTVLTITDAITNQMSFFVTDRQDQYGILPSMDTTVITFEGYLATANRSYLNNYNLVSGSATTQLSDVGIKSGLNLSDDFVAAEDPNVDGTTITSVADWLQQFAMTINARLNDLFAAVFVVSKYKYFSFNDADTPKDFVFTDGTVTLPANSWAISYDQADFATVAENYYTRVIVDPESHAAQVATLAGAVEPYRVYQLNTFNYNTAQAKDYANFLLSTYSDPNHIRPQMLSVNGQSTNATLLFQGLMSSIGATVSLLFRGTEYNCVIEGWAYTATPDQDRYTFYVSGADLNNYLILDDTDRGVLDSNRLGY